jgi:hypothetical protein
MNWIDQNLDAYRVIAEILTDLRPLVRERLESRHGKEWFRDGIPETIFERLIQNKEQEASIDWYENRYQEVISYAVFPDLFEIIIANPGLFDPILKLAPSQSLLNTRFLELEVMRSKIGRARRISEAEIHFLTSFHLRFRRAVHELTGGQPLTATPTDDAVSSDVTGDVTADKRGDDDAQGTPAPEKQDTVEAEPFADSATAETVVSDRPPMRRASPAASPEAKTEQDPEQAAATEPEEAASESASESETPEAPAVRETPGAIVKKAMEEGDDQTVLREVYREVTGIAEVIWTTNETPTTAIWDRVSTNAWYESNFSKLELRPLSDFYELIQQVKNKRKGGAPKSEIQSFLNNSKFATILLSLRDMFQKNSL